jgi:uncharacterized protein YceK
MKILLAISLTLALAGCGSVSTSSGTQAIEQSCAAASAAIRVLTIANDQGKLNHATQTQVLRAIGLVNPICLSPTPPTLDTVKQAAFDDAVSALTASASGVK